MTRKKQHILCIGAQRTSTTRLYSCFQKHPDISVPEEKELHYFNAVVPPYKEDINIVEPLYPIRIIIKYALKFTDNYAKTMYGARSMRKRLLRGRSVPEYYWSRFDGVDGITCDITPAYSLLPEVGVELIHKTAPESKIIYIIRDPVERMWSEINYHYGKTHDGDLSSKFEDQDFLKKNMNRHHLRRGDYSNVHKLYSKYFSDVLVVVFEDMIKDAEENIRKICEFIGVDINEDILKEMPLNRKINASKNLQMPEHIESQLMEFQSYNYKRNIEYFGEKLKNWKYYQNFNAAIDENCA